VQRAIVILVVLWTTEYVIPRLIWLTDWSLADATANPMSKVDDVTCAKTDFGTSASQIQTDAKVYRIDTLKVYF